MFSASRFISTGKAISTVAAVAGFGLLLTSTSEATVTGRQYFGVSAGAGAVVHGQPCPDIPCNTGDVCSCVTSSGKASFQSLEVQGVTYPATFTLEVSADDSTAINNGSGGKCFGTTGMLVLTLKPGTITLPFTGLGCRIGQPMNNTGTFGISAPIYISAGTGKYANGEGTGTISATINPVGGTVLMDVTGYGRGLKY